MNGDPRWPGFDEFMSEVRSRVDGLLRDRLCRANGSETAEVARYVVLDCGHRWRAMTVIAAAAVFSQDPFGCALPAACAMELAHSASMLLDDLPSMDDATLRRGKPCAHLVFPRWAVDMAPVYLVNIAYEMALDHPAVGPERRTAAAITVANAALRSVEGQERDLKGTHEITGADEFLASYAGKTAELFAASAQIGAVLAGASSDNAQALRRCGFRLGTAYQVLDDIADRTAGLTETGKQPGMDAGKHTTVDHLGLPAARDTVVRYRDEALGLLARFEMPSSHPLPALIRHLFGAGIRPLTV